MGQFMGAIRGRGDNMAQMGFVSFGGIRRVSVSQCGYLVDSLSVNFSVLISVVAEELHYYLCFHFKIGKLKWEIYGLDVAYAEHSGLFQLMHAWMDT